MVERDRDPTFAKKIDSEFEAEGAENTKAAEVCTEERVSENVEVDKTYDKMFAVENLLSQFNQGDRVELLRNGSPVAVARLFGQDHGYITGLDVLEVRLRTTFGRTQHNTELRKIEGDHILVAIRDFKCHPGHEGDPFEYPFLGPKDEAPENLGSVPEYSFQVWDALCMRPHKG